MPISIRDKILAVFGISYYCNDCGIVIVGKQNAEKHEKKCRNTIKIKLKELK